MRPYSITNGGGASIVVTDLGSPAAAPYNIIKSQVSDVGGYLISNPQSYPYQVQTMLVIKMSTGEEHKFELQNSNNAAWNLGTQAALNQAISDITAMLP